MSTTFLISEYLWLFMLNIQKKLQFYKSNEYIREDNEFLNYLQTNRSNNFLLIRPVTRIYIYI